MSHTQSEALRGHAGCKEQYLTVATVNPRVSIETDVERERQRNVAKSNLKHGSD